MMKKYIITNNKIEIPVTENDLKQCKNIKLDKDIIVLDYLNDVELSNIVNFCKHHTYSDYKLDINYIKDLKFDKIASKWHKTFFKSILNESKDHEKILLKYMKISNTIGIPLLFELICIKLSEDFQDLEPELIFNKMLIDV